MNTMQIDSSDIHLLLEQAIKALGLATGLNIRLEKITASALPHQAPASNVDAMVDIRINHQTFPFVFKIKAIDRFAPLTQVKQQLQNHAQPPLLIAPKLSDAALDACKTLELNCIDLAGNAHINVPGLLILVKGQKHLPNQLHHFKTGNALTLTNLRMVFAILCRTDLLNAPYREIAHMAGIALGTVGQGFRDMADRGITLGGHEKTTRVLVQPEKLIQEWVTNYPIRLRPKLKPQRFKSNKPDWWKNIELASYQALWGGEVAADKLTHYLKPNFFTLYFIGNNKQKNKTRLILENRLIPDDHGDIELLEAFWDFDKNHAHPDTVPPLLIYADLISSNDPRNIETANMLYPKVNLYA